MAISGLRSRCVGRGCLNRAAGILYRSRQQLRFRIHSDRIRLVTPVRSQQAGARLFSIQFPSLDGNPRLPYRNRGALRRCKPRCSRIFRCGGHRTQKRMPCVRRETCLFLTVLVATGSWPPEPNLGLVQEAMRLGNYNSLVLGHQTKWTGIIAKCQKPNRIPLEYGR